MKGPAHRTTNAIDSHIGKRVAQRRGELGLDQSWLAARLGVDTATMEALEEGRRRIDAGQLLVITKELNMPLGDIFESLQTGNNPDLERLLETLRKLR